MLVLWLLIHRIGTKDLYYALPQNSFPAKLRFAVVALGVLICVGMGFRLPGHTTGEAGLFVAGAAVKRQVLTDAGIMIALFHRDRAGQGRLPFFQRNGLARFVKIGVMRRILCAVVQQEAAHSISSSTHPYAMEYAAAEFDRGIPRNR